MTAARTMAGCLCGAPDVGTDGLCVDCLQVKQANDRLRSEAIAAQRKATGPLVPRVSAADFLANYPFPAQFERCPDCGCETSATKGRPCFECGRDREQAVKYREIRTVSLRSILPGFRDCRFDDALELTRRLRVDAPARIEEAKRSINTIRLVLYGPSRVGKTSLVSAMVRAWCEHDGRSAYFVQAGEIALIRHRWRRGQGDPPEIDRAFEADLLVIDDLGRDPVRHQDNVIPEIIHYRSPRNLPTWYTTWMSRDEVEKHYGDAVAGRIYSGRTMHLAA